VSIAKVASQDVICACALNDALAANRGAAVERLGDKSALERVVKKIGRKDKRVYRLARRKLKEINEQEALPDRVRSQCEELYGKLECLGRFGRWVQDRAMLDLLDRQWVQIEQETDRENKERYRDLRSRFLGAYEDYRNAHEAQIAAEESREAVRAQRSGLLEELRTLSTLGDDAQLAHDLERITARWNELASLPEMEQKSLEREYGLVREAAVARLDELSGIVRRNLKLKRLVARAEQALDGARPLDRKQVLGLVDQVEHLVDAKGADKSVADRFGELRKALDERLNRQKVQAEKRLASLSEKLDELTDAIEKGSLRDAEPLFQSIQAGIDLIESSGLTRKAYSQASGRLGTLAPRLRELQKWRKWGTDQHREGLCVAMEALASEDMRLEAVALRLKDLQMEWKGLDKGGSPLNHPLWERFHIASERVYTRCKPYMDQQAAERDANREQREQLCAELETFLDQADWERMDWRKAVRAEREMRQDWAAMGPVDGRHRKLLEKRFRSALKRLDGHLADERNRNQAHKRELIARVEAQVQESDLDRAIEETKRLQRQWSTSVPARQKEENRLWQRFRAASDAVFARRKEQQEAHANELSENLQQREDLCAEAEKLSESDAGADELAAALRELDIHWRNSEAMPVPRQAAPRLSQRWRKARSLIEHRRQARLKEQRRRDLDLLADQAALCERLERTLEEGVGSHLALEAIETEWQALPTQRSSDLQAAITRRFSRAREAWAQGGDKLQAFLSSFVANGERRAELCLHLEILAQIDSPSDLVKERLRFQVARLTEHMRQGEKDPLEATSRLLQQWYLCGSAPVSEAAALEERFRRARGAIEAMERDNEAA
jgi:hypothetical protein